MAQRRARGAHNSEVTGSKPVAGILVLSKLIAWCRHNLTPLTQRQSTQAHNLGVTGSKPVGGILVLAELIALCRHFHWYLYISAVEMDCRSKVVRSKLTINTPFINLSKLFVIA